MIDTHPYLDGLMGLAVGDALGVPYENRSLEQMRREPCVGMTGYGSHHQPAGTWSDDTSMALCIGDSLIAKGVDPEDVMKRFSAWKNHAKYTATGVTFDVGRTCRKAIEKYDLGAPLDLCGNATENGNGNGGLMRTFPIALYACMHCDKTSDMLNLVHRLSALTHAHPIGLICCGLYALFIREWRNRNSDDTVFAVMARSIEMGRAYYVGIGGDYGEAIHRPGVFLPADQLRSMAEDQLSSTGYAVDTWNTAVWSLLNTDNYRDCVLKAVNCGGDTDTNAAVTGSLAGFVYGFQGIPCEWVNALQNRDLIKRIADQLDEANSKELNAPVDGFTGEHAFLSMKGKTKISIDGVLYKNLTAAWLAQGVAAEHRWEFSTISAHQARRLLRQLGAIAGWDELREKMLLSVTFAKYEQNEALAKKLLDTGNRLLVCDTTGGHDNYLGRCLCAQCQGKDAQNVYGRVLMDVRERLINEKQTTQQMETGGESISNEMEDLF